MAIPLGQEFIPPPIDAPPVDEGGAGQQSAVARVPVPPPFVEPPPIASAADAEAGTTVNLDGDDQSGADAFAPALEPLLESAAATSRRRGARLGRRGSQLAKIQIASFILSSVAFGVIAFFGYQNRDAIMTWVAQWRSEDTRTPSFSQPNEPHADPTAVTLDPPSDDSAPQPSPVSDSSSEPPPNQPSQRGTDLPAASSTSDATVDDEPADGLVAAEEAKSAAAGSDGWDRFSTSRAPASWRLAIVRRLLVMGELERARAELAGASALAGVEADQQLSQFMAAHAAVIELADTFWQQVGESLDQLQSLDELTIGDTTIAIVESSRDRLVYRRSGERYAMSQREIPPGLALELARRVATDEEEWASLAAAFYTIHAAADSSLLKSAESRIEQAPSAETFRRYLRPLPPLVDWRQPRRPLPTRAEQRAAEQALGPVIQLEPGTLRQPDLAGQHARELVDAAWTASDPVHVYVLLASALRAAESSGNPALVDQVLRMQSQCFGNPLPELHPAAVATMTRNGVAEPDRLLFVRLIASAAREARQLGDERGAERLYELAVARCDQWELVDLGGRLRRAATPEDSSRRRGILELDD